MKFPGGNTDGVTPLPIPNREVKPIRADGTVLVTAWKSRSLPGFSFVNICSQSITVIKEKITAIYLIAHRGNINIMYKI